MIRFKAKPADLSPIGGLSGAVHAALDLTLTHRLTTGQIKGLVEWIKAGKPIAEFDPKIRSTPKKGLVNEEETQEDEEDNGSLTWKEMYDHAKATNSVGSFWATQIFVYALVGGFFWLLWTAIVWLIHLL